jgi:hypothetical protein
MNHMTSFVPITLAETTMQAQTMMYGASHMVLIQSCTGVLKHTLPH